jgi:hypothetical protein
MPFVVARQESFIPVSDQKRKKAIFHYERGALSCIREFKILFHGTSIAEPMDEIG